MKFKYIIIAFLTTLLFITSCNDDFMQQDSGFELSEEVVFTREEDFRIYLDGLYNRVIIGHTSDGGAGTYGPFGAVSSPIMYNDLFSDNVVNSGANPDTKLSNTFNPPAAASANYWNWETVKQINYFLRKTQNTEFVDVVDKYRAEAYFFKASEYYDKLMIHGEVPWLVYDLNVDSPELNSARTPRVALVDSIMMSLDFAIEHLEDKTVPYGIINKDMAKFLKAQFCLFEGTFRKYHKNLELSGTANSFLEQAATVSKGIIDSKRYSLYKGADAKSYGKLFTFKKDPKSDGNPEAIMARVYDGINAGHACQRYWEMINHTRACFGASLGAVNEYLCEDGRPIYIGGQEGDYVLNPLFKGFDGNWEELEGRDPRLKQTISKPGEIGGISVYQIKSGETDINKIGITYPDITNARSGSAPLADVGTSVTGYRFQKHWMGDFVEREDRDKGTQTALVYRYGELLLIYAEARTELGQITDEDLELTINDLRVRAGYDFTKYPDAKLTLGNVPDDPYLDNIYRTHVEGTPITPILREIRRERRVELMIEGKRREDILRWRAGGLYRVPMRGMKLTEAKKAIYEKTLLGEVSTNPLVGHSYKMWVQSAKVDNNVFTDSNGFILGYPRSNVITNGTLIWDDKYYYIPLPLQELTLNENLVQNPGW